MKNAFKHSVLAIIALFCAYSIYGQSSPTKNERYVIIENIDGFFIMNKENVESKRFYVYNFEDNISSKSYHVSINELKEVQKFSIASRSEQFDRARRCYVKMEKLNYINTYRKVLLLLEVKYVKIDTNFYKTEDFFNLIRNK